MERLIAIGGVAAGMSAASSFKRIKPDAQALVFEKDYFISYGSCSLPYYISNDLEDFTNLLSITPKVALEERGIDVFLRHEATNIDVVKQEVSVKNIESGETKKFSYDKLVIATGAVPVRPSLPGVDLDRVFVVRTLVDGIHIKNYIDQWHSFHVLEKPEWGYRNIFGIEKRKMKAVIVGGGYIGMEMCESLVRRGIDVTVVEKTDRVLGTMDTGITSIVEEKLKSMGVALLKETLVEGFEGTDGIMNAVLTNKGRLAADMVLLVIGARPNTKLAVDTGIELGAGGAIKVDDYLYTNLPNVLAAGDCAEGLHRVTGKKVYIPLGTTANKQGRIAGENAAGEKNTFDGIVGTAITKVFDLEIARTGLSSLDAQHEGLDYGLSTITGKTRSNAYPAGKPITITYVYEKTNGRLLGAQMAAEEGAAHRIDTLAACLHNGMTLADIARLDLGYAPPFATVWDPILIAANTALKKLQNLL